MGSRRKLRGLTEGLSTTTNNQKNRNTKKNSFNHAKNLLVLCFFNFSQANLTDTIKICSLLFPTPGLIFSDETTPKSSKTRLHNASTKSPTIGFVWTTNKIAKLWTI